MDAVGDPTALTPVIGGKVRSGLDGAVAALAERQHGVGLRDATGWVEADCVWRAPRVVVELDGYASHGTRAAFDRDRARDRALQAAGWRVVRITWRHLHEERDDLVAELRALLGATRPQLPRS
jgi:very-short-patch-repair endonuclease